MPTMIIGMAVSSAVVAGLGATASAIVIGGLTISVGQLIGAAAGMAVSGLVTSAFAEEPARDSGPAARREEGFLVNTSSTEDPIPVWYGYRRVGGSRCYKEVSGPNNEYLYLRYTLSEGPIAGVEQVWINGTLSTDPKFSGLVEIEHHDGADGQAASPMLLAAWPDKWASTDVGTNIAYTVVKLKFNRDVFPAEPAIQFEGRGRLVKDVADSVVRFTNCPASVLRDYLTNTRYGRAIPEAAIVDADWASEATYYAAREAVPSYSADLALAEPASDELRFEADQPFDNGDGVTIATTGTLPGGLAAATTYYVIRVTLRRFQLAASYAGSLARTAIDITTSGSGTHTLSHVDQARYTADGVIDPDANAIDNIVRLRSSAQAWLFDSAGKYRLATDRALAAGFTLTRDNLLGAWRLVKGGKDGRYNRVRAEFRDPALGWETNFALVDSPTDRADSDGGAVLQGVLQLDFTTNLFRARRIAELERRKSRLTKRFAARGAIEAFRCECADVVAITHASLGYSAAPFRVTRIGLGANDEFDFDLREYADIWTGLSPGAAFTPAVRTNLPDPASYAAPPVHGLELFGRGLDTEFAGRDAKFAWRGSAVANYAEIGAEPYGACGEQSDPWFRDWQVRITNTDGTERRTEYVLDPRYVYTLEKNAEDALVLEPGTGLPVREFEILVRARTTSGRMSAIPARLAVSNPVAATGNVAASGQLDGFTLQYDRPADTDWERIEICASAASGFVPDTTPGSGNLKYSGADIPARVRGLSALTTYYYCYRLLDAFGPGSWSAEAAVTTLASVSENVNGPNTGTYDLELLGANGGRIVLAAVELNTYPQLLPAKLSLLAGGHLACGAGAETAVISFGNLTGSIVYTAKPSAPGTVSVALDGGGTWYNLTGTGTDFTQLAANDWLYFGVGKPLLKVSQVLSASSARAVPTYGNPAPGAWSAAGLAFVAYRGTPVTIVPSASISISLAAGETRSFAFPATTALTVTGAAGIFATVNGHAALGAAIDATLTTLAAKWHAWG